MDNEAVPKTEQKRTRRVDSFVQCTLDEAQRTDGNYNFYSHKYRAHFVVGTGTGYADGKPITPIGLAVPRVWESSGCYPCALQFRIEEY